VAWLAVAAVAVLLLVSRLDLSFDLSAFFPQQTTLAHDVLIEQLRSGPGSRLLVIGISGADKSQLSEISDQLRRKLAANPAYVSVLNGEFDEGTTQVPEPIHSYFLLMRDVDYSSEALRAELSSRVQDLAIGGGSALLELIARDPFLITLDVLERLTPVDMDGDMWFAANGSAVLIAETHAQAIDIDRQAEAIRIVRQSFSEIPEAASLAIDITGVGAFSVELRSTIQAEATKRSLLAVAALLLVLFVFFKSPKLLLLAALPISMGFVAGLTLVSLVFETVHGITLAFGFTLLGVAVDYPLHLFGHAESSSGPRAIKRIWPTMRLGMISTTIAYLALVFSGSQGLAQLGLFTAGGVTVAALVTRTWLPLLLGNVDAHRAESDDIAHAPPLGFVAAGLLLGIAAIVIWRVPEAGLWDDQLSSLSPVPANRIAADRDLRSVTISPNMRYQLVVHNPSQEGLLSDSEVVDELLAVAVDDGLLSGWQSVSQILPGQADQERRRANIPDASVLETRLAESLQETPFRSDAFDPFLAAAAKASTLAPLMPEDIASTPLRSWLESRLVQVDDTWVGLISVEQPRAPELAEAMRQWPVAVDLVDLQQSSADLMRDYRVAARDTILVAALIIVLLLWYVRGQWRQTIWISLTVAAALSTTVATAMLLHGSLTVIHLVALLLVLGLGLDYALFLSRSEPARQRRATEKGVLACAASTTLAFGILAGSSIPVLRYLGLTVAAGSAANFLIAWIGSRERLLPQASESR